MGSGSHNIVYLDLSSHAVVGVAEQGVPRRVGVQLPELGRELILCY